MPYRIRDAISQGDSAAFEGCLAAGADVNEVFEDGTSPLLAAVECHRRELLLRLIKAGADVNLSAHPYPLVGLPLGSAYGSGNTEIFQTLRAQGADPAFLASPELVAVFCAVLEGDAESLAAFLTHGGDPNACDALGCPLLVRAAWAGQVECVRLLLDAGVKPDTPWPPNEPDDDSGDITPALAACNGPANDHAGGQLACLELLLERGATQEKGVLLDYAILCRWADGVRLLLERGAGLEPLPRHLGILPELGATEVLAVLLENGLQHSQEGMWQVYRGNLSEGGSKEIAEMLLAAGFQPKKGSQ